MNKNIIWLAKRLKDIAADLEKLTETEKREVVEMKKHHLNWLPYY